jgi:hypothetical protein
MGVYFDSTVASNGTGTIGSPFKYLDNYVITDADTSIYLKYGSVFNVAERGISPYKGLSSTATNQKIVIQPYGDSSQPLPIVYSLEASTNHTSWVECNPYEAAVNGYLVRQTGSKIWHRAGMGSAVLFHATPGARQWGRWKDTMNNLAPYGRVYPSKAYDIGLVNITSKHATLTSSGLGSGTLVYSDGGDPNTVYGTAGVGGQNYSYAVSSLFFFTDPLGGIEIYDIDFRDCVQYAITVRRTATYNRLSSVLIVDGCTSLCSLGLLQLTFAHTGRTKNIGFAKVRIQNNYCERTGNGFFSIYGDTPYVSSLVLNDAIISHNVINGVCQRFSVGGLYLKECHTTDGSYILVTKNCITGSEAGNIWIVDGYAFYCDFSAQQYKFIDNYAWNNGAGTRFNGTVGSGIVRGNVIIAGAITVPTLAATGANNPNSVDLPAELEFAYNVAVGYKTFLGIQDIVADSVFRVHHNISIGNGTGGHGIDCLDTTGISSNYDNFSQGHTRHWNEYSPSTDRSSMATNKLLTNPTSALSSIILTPTDPTFNYALTLPKMDDWTTTPAYSKAICFNPT